MSEAVSNSALGDAGDGDRDGVVQGGQGARFEFTQALLDDEPTWLNRIGVRGVGWQIEQLGPNGSEYLGDALDLMSG